MRLANTTPITMTMAIACISGKPRRSIANRSKRPRPGYLNTFSITMIPPISQPKLIAITVIVGSRALRREIMGSAIGFRT